MKKYLAILGFVALALIGVLPGNAPEKALAQQPCSWNYSFVGGISTAQYCGQVLLGPAAFAQCPSIETYGGGVGLADNLPAWNAFIAQSGTGSKCLSFQVGVYFFSSDITSTLLAVNSSITIGGLGADVTHLNFNGSSGGIALTETVCSQSFHIRNLSINSRTAAGGIGVNATQNAASCQSPNYNAQSDITQVTFRGADGATGVDYWTTNVSLNNISEINFNGDLFRGSNAGLGNGLFLDGAGNTQYTTLVNLDSTTFLNEAQGLVYGSYVQGVNVDKCNFNGGAVGIVVGGSEVGTLAQLLLTNSQFNTTQTQISINTALFNLQAANNNFFIPANFSGINIAAGVSVPFQLMNNWFDGQGLTGNFGVAVGGEVVAGGLMQGNIFYTLSSGINLETGSQNISVQGNQFLSTTTPIINNGTGNKIINNPGYNPVGAAAITTSASPFTYTPGASPEIVTFSATTITAVTIGGVSVLTAALGTTDFTYTLSPNQAIVVTYTGTLVGAKSVQ